MSLVSLFSSLLLQFSLFFFFNDTAPTEIYTLSLHDALPISRMRDRHRGVLVQEQLQQRAADQVGAADHDRIHALERRRSEEHTSELQSHSDLVCRLLLEKKKKKKKNIK